MFSNSPIHAGPYRAIDLEWTPPRRKHRGREAFAAFIDIAFVVAIAMWIGIIAAFLASLTPPASKTGATEVVSGWSSPHLGPVAPVASSTNQPTTTDMKPDIIDADFLRRLSEVESGTNDLAVNRREDAHGRYQIRAQYLQDANEFMGTNYSLQDMHDPIKANTVVWAYLARWGTIYEQRTGREATATDLARIHNGGPRGAERSCTLDYARRFEEAM